eukprot:m.128955 g.128955  ORF g.128955 m.128955 type:complete len:168 (-) comp15686_c0_seq1:3558-4061(-)
MNHWHNQNKQPTKPIHHKHILNNQHLLNTTNPSFMNCWFLFFIHAFHQYMCPSSIHVQARSLCTTGTSRHFKSQVSSLKQWLPDFANEDKKKVKNKKKHGTIQTRAGYYHHNKAIKMASAVNFLELENGLAEDYGHGPVERETCPKNIWSNFLESRAFEQAHPRARP